MNNTKHTPGPWKVNANVGKRGEIGVVADAAPCVIAHGMSEKHWPEIAQANAQLVAAAPELLEALEHICNLLKANNGRAVADVNGWAAKGRQAIAKARGQA